MQIKLSFYHVICHVWTQILYLVFKITWKIKYKLIENYHVENAILGKDFKLGMLAPFFMFSPIKEFNIVCNITFSFKVWLGKGKATLGSTS